MSRLSQPFPAYFLADGAPAAFYVVYFGVANTDPKTNPKAPYSDSGLTVALPATQTLTAEGAFETDINLDGDYSILIEDTLGAMWRETSSIESGFLPLSGGTMTGDLVLSGDADAALEAVTLQQMQAADSALQTQVDDNAANIQSNTDAIAGLDVRITANEDAIDNIINGTDPVPPPTVDEIFTGTLNNGNPSGVLTTAYDEYSFLTVIAVQNGTMARFPITVPVIDITAALDYQDTDASNKMQFSFPTTTSISVTTETSMHIAKVYGHP